MDKLPCHICGKQFARPIAHARQKHNIDAKTYKERFGLDAIKGYLTAESSQKISQKLKDNPEVIENVKRVGVATRFKSGSTGRTKDKVRPQTLERLRKHIKIINKKGDKNV